ncbi:MAG: ArsR/SmtB family transcription factor [Psychrobium sp.]
MTTSIENTAKALKELGHPIRLTIFKRLVKSGIQGLAVGQLQKELQIPNSTLSHHISSLASASLIRQRREGTTLYCVVEYDRFMQVISFLQDECCIESPSPLN